MGEQRTFAGEAWSAKRKVTKREQFLAEMNVVIPWAQLIALIDPHYPKWSGRGRPPMPLDRMLRIYFLQHWFNLSDPGAEEALYDSEAMRRFVGLELAEDAFPDESTILHFRHLLEEHQLTERMFTAVRDLLDTQGLLMKQGTIVDATIIHAPSSTNQLLIGGVRHLSELKGHWNIHRFQGNLVRHVFSIREYRIMEKSSRIGQAPMARPMEHLLRLEGSVCQ